MKTNSLLYLGIYIVTLLFFSGPIYSLLMVDNYFSFLMLVAWLGLSAIIVNVIHFWPGRKVNDQSLN